MAVNVVEQMSCQTSPSCSAQLLGAAVVNNSLPTGCTEECRAFTSSAPLWSKHIHTHTRLTANVQPGWTDQLSFKHTRQERRTRLKSFQTGFCSHLFRKENKDFIKTSLAVKHDKLSFHSTLQCCTKAALINQFNRNISLYMLFWTKGLFCLRQLKKAESLKYEESPTCSRNQKKQKSMWNVWKSL